MTSNNLRSTTRAWLGLAALTLLTGCVGAPRWGAWSKTPSPEQLAATRSQPPVPRMQYQDFVASSSLR
jgi:hypothetical protein